MGDNVWSSRCKTSRTADSYCKRRPKKTWNEVIRSDLKKGNLVKT